MRLANITLSALCLLGAATGMCADAQTARASKTGPASPFSSITQQELTLLLKDMGEANPVLLKRLQDDDELKQGELEKMRQLLAFASEAQRIGLGDEPRNRRELDYIRLETSAAQYDRYLNKGKTDVPPFASITDSRVAAYWGEGGTSIPASLKADRTAKFEQFIDTKVHLVKDSPRNSKDITEEEKGQARDIYTKLQIYAAEYEKSSTLPVSLRQKVNLVVKLQQAQFLARIYSETVTPELTASEAELADYLEAHPELNSDAKKAKAETILARAKGGEDFAKLANEFSEDPGNKNEQGELQGGLYQNVKKGVFVPSFERAALGLEPGQIAADVVESDFGYHIIKLERKGETYDVRHILISTGVDNPSDPNGRPMPVKEYAKQQIEIEKFQEMTDRLIASNKISVPEHLIVPTVPASALSKPATTRKRPARKRR